MRCAQNTRQQNGVVGSTDTAWKRKNTLLPFSRGKPFLSFTHASSLFPLETSGSFFKFNSFLFLFFFFLILILIFLIYLFIPYSLGKATSFVQGKLWIQPNFTPLKIDKESHAVVAEGLGKYLLTTSAGMKYSSIIAPKQFLHSVVENILAHWNKYNIFIYKDSDTWLIVKMSERQSGNIILFVFQI